MLVNPSLARSGFIGFSSNGDILLKAGVAICFLPQFFGSSRMQVYGPTHLHGPQQIGSPHSARADKPTSTTSQPVQMTDELQISEAAQLVDRANEVPDIRQDRVDEIRAKIADGTYETDEKLDIALGRLLDEIG